MDSPQIQQSNADIMKSNKRKLVWGIVCLVGPTALLVASILLYAIMNFIFGSDGTTEPNVLKTIINVVLFFIGAFVVATWLPGIIVGIILIATRKPVPRA